MHELRACVCCHFACLDVFRLVLLTSTVQLATTESVNKISVICMQTALDTVSTGSLATPPYVKTTNAIMAPWRCSPCIIASPSSMAKRGLSVRHGLPLSSSSAARPRTPAGSNCRTGQGRHRRRTRLGHTGCQPHTRGGAEHSPLHRKRQQLGLPGEADETRLTVCMLAVGAIKAGAAGRVE